MCQEMQERPGKDSGKGNPGEAVLVTLRLAGVWSGDQQPWGEREEAEVQCRSPGERGGQGCLSGTTVSGAHPRSQVHRSPTGLSLDSPPETLAQCGTDVFSVVVGTAVVETAANGTVFMPKEMAGILIPVLMTQCPGATYSCCLGHGIAAARPETHSCHPAPGDIRN